MRLGMLCVVLRYFNKEIGYVGFLVIFMHICSKFIGCKNQCLINHSQSIILHYNFLTASLIANRLRKCCEQNNMYVMNTIHTYLLDLLFSVS